MSNLLKNPFVRFIILFSVLVVLWFSLYKNIYLLDGSGKHDNDHIGLEKNVSILLGKNANFFTEIFGFHTELYTSGDMVITRITDFTYSHGTWIGEPCNGLKVMGLFAIFIIAFPGKWKHKWWFVIGGCIIIHFANALRVSGLTIIEAQWPEYLNFNHNVTFQVLIYGIIFLLWLLWVQKFSGLKVLKKNVQQ